MKIISLLLALIKGLVYFAYTPAFSYSLSYDNDYNEKTNAIGLYDFLDDDVVYSSGLYSYDSFLEAYYDNLTHNFGVNYKETCGYVAIGMLLSYYDTFLNDNIIPEQYDAASVGEGSNFIMERNSPGIMRDIITAPEGYLYGDETYVYNLDAYEYYSEIQKLSETSLHAKLITRATFYGYYDFNSRYSPGIITFLEMKNLLNDYLVNIAGILNTDYEILSINDNMNRNESTYTDVKEFVRNQIEAGNPVILTIYKASSNIGHAVIAYDYDDTTGEIYCHMGYGADKTHITPESEGYTDYVSALAIDFKLGHAHTNNYGIISETNSTQTINYYCYDYNHLITYKDFHLYAQNYESISTTQHKAYCECGEYILSEHSFNASSYSCLLCGATHTHDYTYRYVNDSTTMHRSYCICGASCLEPHVVESGSFGGGNKYALCIVCKALVPVGMVSHQSIGSLPHSENGSFILPNGIIVLVDEDKEAYFNRTLEFIYPDDNLVTE